MHNDEECPYHEDAKKWRDLEQACQAEIAQVLFLDEIRKNEKDTQIVKELKEKMKKFEYEHPVEFCAVEWIEKILEGKL